MAEKRQKARIEQLHADRTPQIQETNPQRHEEFKKAVEECRIRQAEKREKKREYAAAGVSSSAEGEEEAVVRETAQAKSGRGGDAKARGKAAEMERPGSPSGGKGRETWNFGVSSERNAPGSFRVVDDRSYRDFLKMNWLEESPHSAGHGPAEFRQCPWNNELTWVHYESGTGNKHGMKEEHYYATTAHPKPANDKYKFTKGEEACDMFKFPGDMGKIESGVCAYITGIGDNFSQHKLLDEMADFGKVTGWWWQQDDDWTPQGTAYIQYEKTEACQEMIKRFMGMPTGKPGKNGAKWNIWAKRSTVEFDFEGIHQNRATMNLRTSKNGDWNAIQYPEDEHDFGRKPWKSIVPSKNDGYYYINRDNEVWKNGKKKTDLRYWDREKAQERWEVTVNQYDSYGRTNLELYQSNAGPQFTTVYYKYS